MVEVNACHRIICRTLAQGQATEPKESIGKTKVAPMSCIEAEMAKAFHTGYKYLRRENPQYGWRKGVKP